MNWELIGALNEWFGHHKDVADRLQAESDPRQARFTMEREISIANLAEELG